MVNRKTVKGYMGRLGLLAAAACTVCLTAGCGHAAGKGPERLAAQDSARETETEKRITLDEDGEKSEESGDEKEAQGGQTEAGEVKEETGQSESENGEQQEESKEAAGEILEFSKDQIIKNQSFDVKLDGWGKVRFVSVKPDGEKRKDVSFYLMKGDETLYQFPQTGESGFQSIAAVSFQDFNRDGKKDVLTLTERKAEDGSTYQTCTVYCQKSEKAMDGMDAEFLSSYLVTAESDKGPAFYRDTLLEEYLSKQDRTKTVEVVMDSYKDYKEYVNGFAKGEEIPGLPLDFSFSSGAGAWSTTMTVHPDGSFEGLHNDSDMGDVGEGYPEGTRYTCSFHGKFGGFKKLNDYSYSMTLESLTMEKEPGEEWMEDKVRYISAEAYGITGGKEFIFYTPDTPTSELSEEFLMWRNPNITEKEAKENTLVRYGILNVETGDGFFSY